MPRQGERFLGPSSRARARARERRRRVFTVLLETVGLTALIGLFPPLRAMWILTGILLVVLGAYVGMLLRLRAASSTPTLATAAREVPAPPVSEPAFAVRREGDRRVVVISSSNLRSRAG